MTRSKPAVRRLAPVFVLTVSLGASLQGCDDGPADNSAAAGSLTGGGGSAGASAGATGTAGSLAASGTGGTSAGSSASAGTGGSAAGGTSLGGGAGSGTTAGSAGSSVEGGSAGSDTAGGSAGSDTAGGSAGSSAEGGSAGSPAEGGSAGAGVGGSGGSGGTGYAGYGGATAPNDPLCPAGLPLMSDPCSGTLVCHYRNEDTSTCYGFPQTATCTAGRWRLRYDSQPICNPPAACPDEEPDPDSNICPGGIPQPSPQNCRYARSTCFVYTGCTNGQTPTWTSGPSAATVTDSCCPAVEPAIGATCAEANIACRYGDASTSVRDLLCKAGTWKTR